VAVQRQEDRPAGELAREPVRGVHRERGEPFKFPLPTSERGHVTRQYPDGCRRGRAFRQRAASSDALEQQPLSPGQVQRVGQYAHGLFPRSGRQTAFQVADRPRAESGRNRHVPSPPGSPNHSIIPGEPDTTLRQARDQALVTCRP
jgi:hypothetical protein